MFGLIFKVKERLLHYPVYLPGPLAIIAQVERIIFYQSEVLLRPRHQPKITEMRAGGSKQQLEGVAGMSGLDGRRLIG